MGNINYKFLQTFIRLFYFSFNEYFKYPLQFTIQTTILYSSNNNLSLRRENFFHKKII